MSAAAVEVQAQDELFATASPALVRQHAAEVLAAHRLRRQRLAGERDHALSSHASHGETAAPSRSQRIASLVTERYAQTQSYRTFLAAEAEEATRKARAVAEVAARTAQAVAEAQQQLLMELAQEETRSADPSATQAAVLEPVKFVSEPHELIEPPSAAGFHPSPEPVVSRPGLTVRLFEDVGSVSRNIPSKTNPVLRSTQDQSSEMDYSDEAQALDEEISFRQSPSFDLERASVPIPGNLLEFPRQLVAARKARPRYAEGPLHEDSDHAHNEAQLRIFEVEPGQITSQPPVESSAADWSSIWLDALIHDAPDEALETPAPKARPKPEAASLDRRIMASVVDTCLASMGFVAFATAFAYTAPVLPSPAIALASSAGALAAILILYQALFFTFSESTPGMRYARIGLCTFEEENPTRVAMLARIPTTLLAAAPLGLGFLWACLDDDRLGWHDRLSGMYQRSY